MTKLLVLIVAISFVCTGIGWTQSEVSFGENSQQKVSYSYKPGDRRDPFQSVLERGQSIHKQEVVADDSQVIGGDWKILGIMTGLKSRKAVLQNIKGQQYMVSAGDVLANENLRILNITHTAVVLETLGEQRRGTHSITPQTIELTLKW